jgi:hypothetical protein
MFLLLPTTKASFGATALHTQVSEVMASPFHPVVDDTRFFDSNNATSPSNASSASSSSAQARPAVFRSISNRLSSAFSSISNSSYLKQPLLAPPEMGRTSSGARNVALDEKRRRLLAALEDYHGLNLLTSSSRGL